MMMLKGQSWRCIRSSLGLSFDAPAAFTKTMTITDDLMWQQTALTVTIASPATGIKRRFAMDTPTKVLYVQYRYVQNNTTVAQATFFGPQTANARL